MTKKKQYSTNKIEPMGESDNLFGCPKCGYQFIICDSKKTYEQGRKEILDKVEELIKDKIDIWETIKSNCINEETIKIVLVFIDELQSLLPKNETDD